MFTTLAPAFVPSAPLSSSVFRQPQPSASLSSSGSDGHGGDVPRAALLPAAGGQRQPSQNPHDHLSPARPAAQSQNQGVQLLHALLPGAARRRALRRRDPESEVSGDGGSRAGLLQPHPVQRAWAQHQCHTGQPGRTPHHP